MIRSASSYLVERILAAATAAVGVLVAVDQFVRDGWGPGGATAWLVLFAVIATVGVIAVFTARRPTARGLRAVGLVAVALSPTVFAYVLNVLVLALAIVEVALLARARLSGAMTRRASAHSG
jgi:phosphoglycerol transferase MdoB-like AlkP superfamily enzyme